MTLVMGVLNITPDSFSDGGRHLDVEDAVRHGMAMVAQGAGIIDVGGESTRPGASRVDTDEECTRVVPVVAELARRGVHVSIDTMRASTAEAAVLAGARTVNDVSGGRADRHMFETIAAMDVDYVIMHWRGHALTMQSAAHYADVVGEVTAELLAQRDAATRAGVDPSRIILDPGIGFAKLPDHGWTLLRRLDHFTGLGHRVLVGVSRKRLLGDLLGGRPPGGRDVATAAVSGWCAQHGIWGVRTHEVAMQADAIAVGTRLMRG